MLTAVQPYLDLILKERSWSWAVVCMLYIISAFTMRGWFVGPVSAKMKGLDGKVKGKIKKNYLKRSMLGWLLFFLPLLSILYYWQKDFAPILIRESWLIGFSIGSFVLSIIVHLQALGSAALLTLSSQGTEKLRDI